jgi:uncharacterized membrane protein
MDEHTRDTVFPLTLLAAASGARTWAGVAAIEPRSVVPLFAAGELIFDKLPNVQDRTDGASLLGRIAAGAVIGAMVGGRTGTNRIESAILGGLVAVASAYATHRMRRALGERLPAVAAALTEDAIVVGAAAAGAALLRRRVRSRAEQRMQPTRD